MKTIRVKDTTVSVTGTEGKVVVEVGTDAGYGHLAMSPEEAWRIGSALYSEAHEAGVDMTDLLPFKGAEE